MKKTKKYAVAAMLRRINNPADKKLYFQIIDVDPEIGVMKSLNELLEDNILQVYTIIDTRHHELPPTGTLLNLEDTRAYSATDLLNLTLNSEMLDVVRVLATYADHRNWIAIHNGSTDEERYKAKASEWAFIGPVRPPWELAEHTLHELRVVQAGLPDDQVHTCGRPLSEALVLPEGFPHNTGEDQELRREDLRISPEDLLMGMPEPGAKENKLRESMLAMFQDLLDNVEEKDRTDLIKKQGKDIMQRLYNGIKQAYKIARYHCEINPRMMDAYAVKRYKVIRDLLETLADGFASPTNPTHVPAIPVNNYYHNDGSNGLQVWVVSMEICSELRSDDADCSTTIRTTTYPVHVCYAETEEEAKRNAMASHAEERAAGHDVYIRNVMLLPENPEPPRDRTADTLLNTLEQDTKEQEAEEDPTAQYTNQDPVYPR